MNLNFNCQNCGLNFNLDSELINHKKKFCINSKYSDLNKLEEQFKQVSKYKDIGIYGRKSLVRENKLPGNDIDKQYRQLLRQISQNKTLQDKFVKEKLEALKQLQALDKWESQLVVQKKRNQLKNVINKKQQLRLEEEQLQKQLKLFQNKKQQYDEQIKKSKIGDIYYQEGQKVGKIQLQRQILEEELHEIKNKIGRQKHKYQKMIKQMQDSVVSEPTYLKNSQYQPSPQLNLQASRGKSSKVIEYSNYSIPNPTKLQHYTNNYNIKSKLSKTQNKNITHSKTQSYSSNYLRPDIFTFNDKLLTQQINPKGKTQEDLVIESLLAQDYDDLKILSQLPKQSQLYNLKLKYFQEMSQIRTDMKQKIQIKRVQRMKRQFQFNKKMQQHQRQNQYWVDQNRKLLLSRQAQIVHNLQQNTNKNPQLNLNFQKDNNVSQNHQNLKKSMGNKLQNSQTKNMIESRIKQYIPSISNRLNQANNGPQRNKSQNRNKPQQVNSNLWGYKITILNLRNYRRTKPIKFRLLIFEQNITQRPFKQQFNTTYHDVKVRPQIDAFTPNQNNKFDNQGRINYNESFIVKKNLQELHNRNQQQIYLYVILAQKDQDKITNEPSIYAWYCFKITHFSRIRQGKFSFHLYGDQFNLIPVDMNKMKRRFQQEVQIQLEEILLSNIPQEPIYPKQISRPDIKPIKPIISQIHPNEDNKPQSIHNPTPKSFKKKTPEQQVRRQSENSVKKRHSVSYKEIKQKILEEPVQDYYIPNNAQTQFFQSKTKDQKNFDIVIGGARTLPSFVGPIKLQINYIDHSGLAVFPKEEILSDLGGDMYNPQINYIKQFRNEKLFPPSTIIFIRILTISTLDYQIYMLGFSVIYLSFNQDGSSVSNNKNKDYLMTTGYYQLPIFWGVIEPKFLEINLIASQYPTIPCSSLLVGVILNQSHITNPLPNYNSGLYNTILFQVDQIQLRLFQEQYKREKLNTNQHVKGFLQYKGITKDYSGQQAAKFIFKTMVFTKTPQKYNLNAMAEYQKFFGICFILDNLQIEQGFQSYYYYITICLCPPANYYHKKNFDLQFSYKINPDKSSRTKIHFNDNQFMFQPPFNKNTSLIIQINRIKIIEDQDISDDLIQGYGYQIIPLFDHKSSIISVNVCKNSLQVYSGDINFNQIGNITSDLDAYLQNKNFDNSNLKINFRILNGYFKEQYQPDKIKLKNKDSFRNCLPQGRKFQDIYKNALILLKQNYNLNFK